LKPLDAAGPLETTSEEFNAAQQIDDMSGVIHDFFTNYFEDGSAEFERLVSRGNVAAVYMGHIHAFWVADHLGVRYIISGGGGSPLYPLPPGFPKERFAHYMTVEASPSGLVETIHPYHGSPFVLPPVDSDRPESPPNLFTNLYPGRDLWISRKKITPRRVHRRGRSLFSMTMIVSRA